MTRQLAIAKRVSLAGIGQDWGDECYAYMRPANYNDMADIAELGSMSKADQVKFQVAFLKEHFVSGKIKLVGSDDVVDMEADDTNASIEMSDRLFNGCIGVDLDPKDTAAAQPAVDASANDAKPTATPSSTDSNTSPTTPSES